MAFATFFNASRSPLHLRMLSLVSNAQDWRKFGRKVMNAPFIEL